jgi:hypothetical protein
MIETRLLIDAARDLRSAGENREYDRALVELVTQLVTGDQSDAPHIARLLGVRD